MKDSLCSQKLVVHVIGVDVCIDRKCCLGFDIAVMELILLVSMNRLIYYILVLCRRLMDKNVDSFSVQI